MRALVLAVVLVAGCQDSAPNEPSAARPAHSDASTRTVAEGDDAADASVKPQAPAAPPGAIVLSDPPLFVQTCAEPNGCPELLQIAGEKHCAQFELGALKSWRLPTRREVARMRGQAGLDEASGYHWTSTPFEQDPGQVWIVDPESDQPTTVPRDRKPFRIRCVREP